MAYFTITNPNFKFKEDLTTSIASVTESGSSLSIALDAFPDNPFTITDFKSNHGLKEGKRVTLSFISDGKYKFEFTPPAQPKGSGPEAGFRPIDRLA